MPLLQALHIISCFPESSTLRSLFSLSISLLLPFLFPFFQFSLLLIIPIALMASFSSRKRRECTPNPSEGEDFSGSAQSESHEVIERLAFLLRDPWYTPSLSFPQVSHGESLPSPYAWVFSGQAGFAGSAQVSDPREMFDLQIR